MENEAPPSPSIPIHTVLVHLIWSLFLEGQGGTGEIERAMRAMTTARLRETNFVITMANSGMTTNIATNERTSTRGLRCRYRRSSRVAWRPNPNRVRMMLALRTNPTIIRGLIQSLSIGAGYRDAGTLQLLNLERLLTGHSQGGLLIFDVPWSGLSRARLAQSRRSRP
jgi:hypothetical protein